MEFKKVIIASLVLGLLILFSIELKSQGVPNYVPSSGLVGWWPFTGNAIDSSGSGNNGTVNGASLTTDRYGRSNQAYYFNGSSYISAGVNNAPTGNSEATLNAWFYVTSTSSSPTYIICAGSTNASQTFGMGEYGGSGMFSTFSGSQYDAISGTICPTNNWHMFTAVHYKNGVIKLFIDGTQFYSTTVSTPSFNMQSTMIGDAVWGGSKWTGKIDDLGFWSRTLSNCEIKQLYLSQSQVTPTLNIGNDTIRVCKADSLKLTANNGFASYSWSTGATSKSIYLKTSGKVVITATDSFGCKAKDSAIVSILNPKIAPRDTVVCKGAQVTLRSTINNNSSVNTTCGYMPNALRSGMVAWYPFCGNANDGSGNGNNGTVNGASLTTDRFGKSNMAYNFNGSNNYINVPHNSIFDFSNNINFTYSLWLKLNGSQSICGIIGKETSTIPGIGCQIMILSNKIRFDFMSNGSSFIDFLGSKNLNDSNWHNVVLVANRNSNELKFYIDGQIEAQLTNSNLSSGNVNNTSSFKIGVERSLGNFFNGKIDDIGVWNRALSNSEISQLYTLQSSPAKLTWSTSDTTSTTKITANANTKVWLKATDGIGTCYDTTNVIVRNKTLDIGKDTIRSCKLDSLQLSGSNGFVSYAWSNGASSKSTYVKSTGKVVLTATDSFGCKAKDSAIVSILNPKIAPRDTVVCKGSKITLRSSINNNSSTTNNACGYLPNTLKSGLVAWYPFCGNANDGSGNGNNGTATNATLTTDRNGTPNQAYAFNSSNASRIVVSGLKTNMVNTFTYSVWVNSTMSISVPTQGGQYGYERQYVIHAIHGSVYGANCVGSGLVVGNNGLFVSEHKHGWQAVPLSFSGNMQGWHLVTIVYKNKRPSLYLDGVFIKNGVANSDNVYASLGTDNNGYANYINSGFGAGYYPNSNTFLFDGKIDDIIYYDRDLSASEVSQLYLIGTNTNKLTWSTSDTSSTTKITANANTKVWLKATDGIGTCYDTTNVIVRNKTLDIGKDTIRTCKLDSLQLSGGSGFASYSWSNGASNKSTYLKSSGKVVLTATDSFGCKAKDSAIVSILNPKIAPRDTVVCKGAQVTLRSTINNNSSVNSTCGYMPNALRSGLVGWYPFCGNANDGSGNGNNGTVNGANLTIDRFGMNSNAYSFNGSSSYISTSSGFSSIMSLTYSGWIKSSIGGFIISQGHQTGGFELYMHNPSTGGIHDGKICFYQSISGGGIGKMTNSTFNDSLWHHVVGLLHGYSTTNLSPDSMSIFVDGQLVSQSNVTSVSGYLPSAPNYPFRIGSKPTLSNSFMNGKIDDIGIWNRALSTTEISQLYTLQSSPTKLTWSTSDTTSTTKITATSNTKVWLKATDGIGTCYDTTNVYVSNPQLNVVNDTLKFTACNRDSIRLSVGSKWSSTQWSNGSKDSSIYLKTTGKYKVTVKDQYGCAASDSTYFINPGKPKINSLLADSVNCFAGNDGSITSTYSGGFTPYSFLWNDASKQTSANAYNLSKGTYKMVLADAYGCKDSLTANVYEPLKLSSSISFNDSVNCYGGSDGSLQVNVSGGVKNYKYLWNDANKQKTAKANNLKQGSYKVVISDYYNCKDSITAVVSEPAKLQASLIYADSVNCFGGNDGSIKINVVGGVKNYKFLWSDMQTTQNANNLKKGSYKVLVSDHYNCKDSISAAINEPLKLQVSLLSNDSVNCFGGSDGNLKINVAGGVKNYKFLWSNSQTTQDVSSLKKGTYKVMVSDYYNCKDSLSSVIEEPAKLQVSLVSTDSVNCYAGNDGSIKINVVGGVKNYTFLWSDNQTTQDASSLKKGLYKVMVNDYYQCKDSLSASIYEPAKLTVGLMSVDSVNCFSGSDGSIQVNVSGGVKNYKTVWNDPGKQNTLKASNLKKGTYKVMVSDYYNCKDSLTVKVDEPAKLTASIVLVDSVNCFGGKDGKIQVSVAGGVKNYNYIWNDAAKQKTALASNLQKGTYKVLVSDYYACKDSATASALEPNKLVASINYVDSVNCFGGSDGSITTNINGGVKTYKYLWSDNQKTQNAYNLKKGTYKLIVSDYYNCKDSATATVYEPLKLVVSVVSTDSVNCFGGNDGSIRVKVVGGSNGYTYLWNDINKQKTPLASNLSKRLYRVSVKDIYGCADSLTANVYEPAKVVLKIQSFKNASCFGYSNGSALAGASGGTGGFRYTWNTAPVQTGTSAIGLRKGTYRATVVDAYGCSDTASVVIAEPQQIVPKISANRLAVRDILHELSSTVTPAQKYTYNWTPSSVFGKQSNAAVINGKFYTTTLVTLRTTDAAGCFGEDTATITVFIPFADFIPTVFSPNGDSHNDVFGLPDYFEIEQFDVYNRWGALLFRGSASNPTWDGIYEGKLVPVGTYMYIIKAKLKNTVYEFEHQGTVTVLR